jgi:hypothetical protein
MRLDGTPITTGTAKPDIATFYDYSDNAGNTGLFLFSGRISPRGSTGH